ncbi:hypothetical protein RYX36_009097, partial [Vicia faba]
MCEIEVRYLHNHVGFTTAVDLNRNPTIDISTSIGCLLLHIASVVSKRLNCVEYQMTVYPNIDCRCIIVVTFWIYGEDMDANVITIENSISDEKLLSVFCEEVIYSVGIGPGVYSIHSPRIPPTEEICLSNFLSR